MVTRNDAGNMAGTVIGTIVGVIAFIFMSHWYYENYVRSDSYSTQSYIDSDELEHGRRKHSKNVKKVNSVNKSDIIQKSQTHQASSKAVQNPLLSYLDGPIPNTEKEIGDLQETDDYYDSINGIEVTEQVQLEGIIKSGYLYKKATNLRKEWLRRWFFIKDGKLYYIHKPSDLSTGQLDIKAVLVSNLLISTVKQISSLEFHVISPGERKAAGGGGVYELQTESDSDTKAWINVIRQQILGSLTSANIGSTSTSSFSALSSTTISDNKYFITLQQHELEQINEANPKCADCHSPYADWVSINLCVTICIECSGIHRSLGTHISKVRSLTLDKWTPNSLKLLLEFGNDKANSFWEGKDVGYSRDGRVPISRQIREYFITQKYVNKTFSELLLGQEEANVLLIESCRTCELYHIYIALCNNANINIKSDFLYTPLHLCCLENNALCVELLCLWNGDALFAEIDAEGKTAEDIARERQFTDIVALLNAYKSRS